MLQNGYFPFSTTTPAASAARAWSRPPLMANLFFLPATGDRFAFAESATIPCAILAGAADMCAATLAAVGGKVTYTTLLPIVNGHVPPAFAGTLMEFPR